MEGALAATGGWRDLVNFRSLVPENVCPSFEELWAERVQTEEHRKVLVYTGKEGEYVSKRIYRYFKAYLRVPGFDAGTGKSYMFSGQLDEAERFVCLPTCLEPLHDFVRGSGVKFDQCLVNWYEPEDYIEPHSDCTAKLDPAAPILVVNLNEDRRADRGFMLAGKGQGQAEMLRIYLKDRLLIEMKPGLQELARHSVDPGVRKRISVTFRKLKED